MEKPHPSDPLAQYLSQTPARSGVAGFVEGMRVPWDGYCYLRRHPRLWRYGWLPLVLNTVLSAAAFAAFTWAGVTLYQSVAVWAGDAWWAGVVKVMLGVGVGVLVLGAGVGMALLFSVIFCSYFYVALTRAVERQLGTPVDELKEVPFWRDLVDNLRGLMELVVGNAVLLALNLVPAAGTVLSGVGSWYFNSYLLGCEFMEYPWAVRGWDRRGRRGQARAHRAQVLGLGTVVALFNLVPILGGAVLITAVTGSVFLRRRQLLAASC